MEVLEVLPIGVDENGETAPAYPPAAPPPSAKGRCLDAAWGYKTSKSGAKEVGFGFHQHTICRVPDPRAEADREPLLVDGFVITPANSDAVESSLTLVDRIIRRHEMKRLIGDMLYTNLKGGRWAVPLARRGIEKGPAMRSDNHGIADIDGAQMQHGFLHCAAAPMRDRPIPPSSASDQEWGELHEQVAKFQRAWTFDRRESGLGPKLSTKWICPARAGRAGCWALGPANVEAAATEMGIPAITPPQNWLSRPCCTNKGSLDFTPDPNTPSHQRKLMQREYYGSRRWRRLMKRHSLIEGIFGILKNPSRQRMRRGHNRLPGRAMASIVAAIKISHLNEEQLRSWRHDTERGPADHPLLQPDPACWGFRDLTKAEAKAIDAKRLRRLRPSEMAEVA